mmetsp:Transcript_8472/g.10710  ORF Transcript_8472/g.10710 Transcript_8472/m.10710 type:complete len:288 (+) Transcript_8472:120-983(+)
MGNIDSLLFRPPEPTPLHPGCRFWLKTAYGNKIPAIYFKRETAKITFLYSHANAEDLGLMFGWLKCLSKRLNVNILAYDYTGYGESEGTPSEENCYADIDAAYEHLTSFRETDPRDIVLYGRSVGSGPSTFLAAKLSNEGEELGGLILECPFKSVMRVVADVGCTVMNDRFPNIDRISTVRCPTLIIHGTEDRMIPIDHGAALHEAIEEEFRAEPYWAVGKGHNDLDYNFDPLIIKMKQFLYDYVGDYGNERMKGFEKSKSKSRRKISSPKRGQVMSISTSLSSNHY